MEQSPLTFFRETYPPVTQEKLETFEYLNGYKVPTQVRNFYLLSNGGDTVSEKLYTNDETVDCVFKINDIEGVEDTIKSIEDNFYKLGDVLEGKEWLMPLCPTLNRNTILVAHSGANIGSIYITQYDFIDLNPEIPILKLTDSFHEFLATLR